MEDSVDDKMIREIIGQCNVYPKQNPAKVREHVKKVAILIDKESDTSVSKSRLIRKTSKAMDLKSKIENDGWIKFEQDTISLENFR